MKKKFKNFNKTEKGLFIFAIGLIAVGFAGIAYSTK